MNASRQLSKEKVMFNSLVDFFFGPREEQDVDELGEITPEAWKKLSFWSRWDTRSDFLAECQQKYQDMGCRWMQSIA